MHKVYAKMMTITMTHPATSFSVSACQFVSLFLTYSLRAEQGRCRPTRAACPQAAGIPLRPISQVIHVSLETTKIVNDLPKEFE